MDNALRSSWSKSDFFCLSFGALLMAFAIRLSREYGGVEFIALGLLLVFVSAAAMHHTDRIFDFRYLSIPGIWYFAYVVLIFIPSLLMFPEKPEPYRYTYIFSVGSALVTVPFGVIIASVLFDFRRGEIEEYYKRPLEENPRDARRLFRYKAALALAIGLTISWYFEQSTPIPLFYMLTNPGEAGELAWLRDYSFKLLDSPIRYFYHLTRDFIYPLLILVSLGNYLHSRRRSWLILLVISAVFGFLYAAANVARSPAVTLILLMLIFSYILNGGRIGIAAFALGLPMLFVFPVTVQVLSRADWTGSGVLEAFQTVLERIFIAPSGILYYFFEVVPDQVPFLYGRGMGSITKLVGVEYFDLGHYVGTYVLGPGGNGYSSATAAFVAELYTDFGMIGVIVGGMIVGIVMQRFQISIVRRRKTVFALATYTLLIYFFFTLVFLQIVGALLLSGLPLLWILFRTKWLG